MPTTTADGTPATATTRPLLDREVDLGGQAAPGASEPMVGRLDGDPAGRLFLKIPLFAAPAACW
ncbi:hypothetical protein ACFRFU_40210 [Streptomyces sp. NPDC056704]|uniref:hypothetical protein n=1 Tax=Streptomyces sp. NPDC056704 TaxID=3345917 RepID=UPI0036B34F9A